jgi:hypothetical protein
VLDKWESIYACRACDLMYRALQDRPRILKQVQPRTPCYQSLDALTRHISTAHPELDRPPALSASIASAQQKLVKLLSSKRAYLFDHPVCEQDFRSASAQHDLRAYQHWLQLNEFTPIDLRTILIRVVCGQYTEPAQLLFDVERVFVYGSQYDKPGGTVDMAAQYFLTKRLPVLRKALGLPALAAAATPTIVVRVKSTERVGTDRLTHSAASSSSIGECAYLRAQLAELQAKYDAECTRSKTLETLWHTSFTHMSEAFTKACIPSAASRIGGTKRKAPAAAAASTTTTAFALEEKKKEKEKELSNKQAKHA